MAEWITHLMIADEVLARMPSLDRRGFCVGSIAPDCNLENADFTAFTPPREVTHWMQGARKTPADAEAFRKAYLEAPNPSRSAEKTGFLLGYYAHLLADARFQEMIRDETRVKAVWRRIHADESFSEAADGMPETWDSAKSLIPKADRLREIRELEARYLAKHPESGYLTEILPLKAFGDHLDYLPSGCIVRKIGVMGYHPTPDASFDRFIAISEAEFSRYVEDTTAEIVENIQKMGG